jgi:transcriptional regulator with XRE-family HTH domain
MELEAVYERIGGNIRRAREDRDVKQSELADALGVTRTVVTNMETGRQAVKVHQLLVIANVLGVGPDKLLAIDPATIWNTPVSNDATKLPENLASVVSQLQRRVGR